MAYRAQNQPVILLRDCPKEIVDITGFTPQAMEQVNQATALIVGDENGNTDPNDEMKRELTRNEFIAFSSLLARNFNNPYFRQFAENLEFSRLFKAYREQKDDIYLMDFFIQVANRSNLTPQYLAQVEDYIKHRIVATGDYEDLLQNSYNTIKDMFIVEGANQ